MSLILLPGLSVPPASAFLNPGHMAMAPVLELASHHGHQQNQGVRDHGRGEGRNGSGRGKGHNNHRR